MFTIFYFLYKSYYLVVPHFYTIIFKQCHIMVYFQNFYSFRQIIRSNKFSHEFFTVHFSVRALQNIIKRVIFVVFALFRSKNLVKKLPFAKSLSSQSMVFTVLNNIEDKIINSVNNITLLYNFCTNSPIFPKY